MQTLQFQAPILILVFPVQANDAEVIVEGRSLGKKDQEGQQPLLEDCFDTIQLGEVNHR